MTKEELLPFCRYYKGEDSNPHEGKNSQNAMFWDYERTWVEMSERHDEALGDALVDYLRAGLREFEQFDDTPATLKALLFNRYEHWNMDGQFKDWYLQKYLG